MKDEIILVTVSFQSLLFFYHTAFAADTALRIAWYSLLTSYDNALSDH